MNDVYDPKIDHKDRFVQSAGWAETLCQKSKGAGLQRLEKSNIYIGKYNACAKFMILLAFQGHNWRKQQKLAQTLYSLTTNWQTCFDTRIYVIDATGDQKMP